MDEVEAARTSHMKQDMDATYFGGISKTPTADRYTTHTSMRALEKKMLHARKVNHMAFFSQKKERKSYGFSRKKPCRAPFASLWPHHHSIRQQRRDHPAPHVEHAAVRRRSDPARRRRRSRTRSRCSPPELHTRKLGGISMTACSRRAPGLPDRRPSST